jgi:hypothetical protein
MVNVGATRFRGRRVALPADRSVSAVFTSDDGDVRAPSSEGWQVLPENSDPFASARISPTVLQRFARDGIGLVAALGKIPRHGLSFDWHCAYSPGLRILKNREVGQKSIDPAAQQQLPDQHPELSGHALSMGRTARQSNVLPRREFLNEQGLIFGACDQSTAVVPDGTPPNPLEVLRGAFDGLSGGMSAMA